MITHAKGPMVSPDIAIFTRPFELAIPYFFLIANVKFVSYAMSEPELSKRRRRWHPPYRNEGESGPRSFLRKSLRQR